MTATVVYLSILALRALIVGGSIIALAALDIALILGQIASRIPSLAVTDSSVTEPSIHE